MIIYYFLGASAKLQNAISFVMSVCLSLCLGSQWTEFDEIWYMSFPQKSVDKIEVSLKTEGITGTLHEDISQYLAEIFLEWEMFQIKVVDKIKSRRLIDNVERYDRGAANEIMAARCMLDK